MKRNKKDYYPFSETDLPGKSLITYKELENELTSYIERLNIPKEYVEKSIDIEQSNHPGHPSKGFVYDEGEKEEFVRKIASRAIFLQSAYETASQLNIDQEYIAEQVEPYLNQKEIWKGMQSSNLGEMNKKILNKIIKNASKMQKKRGRNLESRFSLFIISISIFLTGLFFLSYRITGNTISGLANSTLNIAGIILFVVGLIAIILLLIMQLNSNYHKKLIFTNKVN